MGTMQRCNGNLRYTSSNHPIKEPINQFHLHSHGAIAASALRIPATLACRRPQASDTHTLIPSSLLSNTAPSESVEHSAAADMQPQPGPTQTSQHSATQTPRIAWRRRGRRASSRPNGYGTRSKVGCVGTDLMTILDMLTRALAAQICARRCGIEGQWTPIGYPMLFLTVREADRG